jgi:uncharacterized protein (TIGR03437 family)
MRSRIFVFFGCISLIGCIASAQVPTLNQNGIVNAAGLGHTTTIVPGSLISIFGSGLASGLSVANSVTLSTTLADVNSVMINGVPAGLQSVSGGQINAQAPWELTPGTANVVVTRAGNASAPMAVQVSQFWPALYALNSGTGQAIATNADGSVVGPVSGIIGIASHPATAGDTITLYASGLGPLDQPPPADGAGSSDMVRNTTTPLTVMMGGVPAQVTTSILSPQFVGVYQVNVVVPSGVTVGGAVPVQLMIGGVTSADMLTIALQ